MTANETRLNCLRMMKAGLLAEIEVLQTSSQLDLEAVSKEVQDEDSIHNIPLPELTEIRDFYKMEVANLSLQVESTLLQIKDLSHSVDNFHLPPTKPFNAEQEQMDMIQLRGQVLQFAKSQFPVEQDQDKFQGGDFWDAVVSHCARPDIPIEYSVQHESTFAELLLQAGICERDDDLGGGGGAAKRIRMVKELF
jgi:hypothetical protein